MHSGLSYNVGISVWEKGYKSLLLSMHTMLVVIFHHLSTFLHFWDLQHVNNFMGAYNKKVQILHLKPPPPANPVPEAGQG